MNFSGAIINATYISNIHSPLFRVSNKKRMCRRKSENWTDEISYYRCAEFRDIISRYVFL